MNTKTGEVAAAEQPQVISQGGESTSTTTPETLSTPPTPTDKKTPSTATKAVSGAAWNFVGQGYQQVLRLFSNVLLSKFVTPDVFGTMGLVTQLNQALYMFSDVGIGTSIINHKKGGDLVFLRTAWSVQIVRSIIITTIGMALAYPFAWFFSDETHPTNMLFWVTLATTMAMLINGFQSVALFLGARELRVARVLLLDLFGQTLGTGVSILLAWNLHNVWALVIGNLIATTVRVVMSFFILQKLQLRWCWDEEARRDMFSFGRWILISTVLTFAANSMDRFILGKLLGLSLFGLYNTAIMFAMVPIELMLRITTSVVMPAYAKKKNPDGSLPEEVFDRVGMLMLLVSGCLIAGVVATAPGFVRAVYKPAYHGAAAIVPWLGLAAWTRVLHNNSIGALLAMGKAKSSALGNGLKLAALVVLVPLGYHLFAKPSEPMLLTAGVHGAVFLDRSYNAMSGVVGACIGLTIAELFKYAASVWDARRAGLRPFKVDIPGTLEFGFAFGIVLLIQWFLRSKGVAPALEALIAGTAVIAVYLPLMYRGGRLVAKHVKLPAPARKLLRV
ncbi:MAG: oligosaccharide flippase family protein [Phycisphaerales bacterium]